MWRSEMIARATTGVLHGRPFESGSVAIDSRKVEKGALFVALKGDRVDGHDYLKEAFARGAAGALVHRMPEGAAADASLIRVNDTYKALVDLAMAARARSNAKIIAVTGSVGKTGTKEAIRTSLAAAGATYATQGNLNNHIGLPLSLANLPEDAAYGVFELGMNHAGEIAFLTRIASPDIAVITNVEAVHLEFFENVGAIADAKAEIIEGLRKGGTLVLNRDNAFYERLVARAKELGVGSVVTFGEHEAADCRLTHYAVENLGSQVEAMIGGTAVTYRLGTVGRHWALTSLAALAAATAAGADLADAAAALAHFHEPEGRGRLLRADSVTLIDDCYNASPSSMQAGIAKLAELHASLGGHGRKVAILGDMLELGRDSGELHRGLRGVLEEQGIDLVFAAGPLMKQLYDVLPSAMKGVSAASAAELVPRVAKALKAGDIALIKGSRGSRMDIVRDALFEPTHKNSRESADAL